ncbi:MAG: ribosome recycling factor [Fibrobacterota bacterium]
MAVIEEINQETEQRMAKSLESLKRDFSRIRTGRASPSLLEGVTVDYYGSPMPISQVGNISVPEARLMIIQPWEKNMLAPIEKAIMASDLGLNPQNDGNVIRVPIPPLSEDRRKDLYKTCKKTAEESKIAVRNIRRDSNEKLKKAEKNKEITQDDQKKAMESIQQLTDKFIKAVDDQLTLKEKEIMEV